MGEIKLAPYPNAPTGLPWEAQAAPESHRGWQIIATQNHYSNAIVASYMGEKDAKAVCKAINAMYGEWEATKGGTLKDMVMLLDHLIERECKDYPGRVATLRAMKFKLKHHTCWRDVQQDESPWGNLSPSGEP